MQRCPRHSVIGSFVAKPIFNPWFWGGMVALSMLSGLPAQGQVIPDATLGAGNNSVTTTTGNRTDVLGGLRRNSSLFHSFDRFDVLTNQQVYFANPANIRNIFSRVTGGSVSNIDGLLGVSGSANLFLMNPNGIIFGPNSRLDVAGSFLATTANALEFADNQRFAATGDRAVPLVEVNIPIGLQMGTNAPAMLTNQGNLAVGPGQGLTLAGQTTSMTGSGSLTAIGGTVQVLGNQVSLQDQSQIDVSAANGGGTIQVGGGYQGQGTLLNAEQTRVAPGTRLNADATTQGNGGTVVVWADGQTRFEGTITARGGVLGGNGGLVETSGKQILSVGNTAWVSTFAPQGQAGNWLLDPRSITIINGTGNTIPTPPPTPTAQDIVNAVNATADTFDATIGFTVINTALGLGNVTLTTTNTPTSFITVDTGTNLSIPATRTLRLESPTVNFNAPIAYAAPSSTLAGNPAAVNVNLGGNIQNGVDVAASGATVNVAQGNFAGAVNIDKSLNLAFSATATPTNLTGGNLNVDASAPSTVSLSGNLVVQNDVILTAGAGSINTTGLTLTTPNLAITADGAVNLQGNVTVANDLDITAGGAITGGGNLRVTGNTSLDAGNNDINLSAIDLDTVEVTNANNLTLTDSNDLALGTVNTTGDINVSATGTLNLSNSIQTGDGRTITLSGNNVTANLGGGNSITARSGTVNLLAPNTIDLIQGTIDVSGATGNDPGGIIRIGGSLSGTTLSNATRITDDNTRQFTLNVASSGNGSNGSVFLFANQLPSGDFRIADGRGLLVTPSTVNANVPTQNPDILFNVTYENITIFNGNTVTVNGLSASALADNNQLYIAEQFLESPSFFFNYSLTATNQFTIQDLADGELTLQPNFPRFTAGRTLVMLDGNDVIRAASGGFTLAVGDPLAQTTVDPTASLTIGGVIANSGNLTIQSIGSLTGNGSLTSTTGNVNLLALGNINLNGATLTAGGTVTAESGNQLVATSNLVTTGGAIDLTASNGMTLTGSNITTGGGSFTAESTNGQLSIASNINTALNPFNGGDVRVTSGGNLNLTGTNLITNGGDITANSGGELTLLSNVGYSVLDLDGTGPDGFSVAVTLASAGNMNLAGGTFITSGGKLDAQSTNGALTLSNNIINTSVNDTNLGGSVVLIGNGNTSLVNSRILSESNAAGSSQIWIESLNGSASLTGTTISAANPQGSPSNAGLAGDVLVNANNTVTITNSSISTSGNSGRIFVGTSDIGGTDFSPTNDPTPQSITVTNSELTTTNARTDGATPSGTINLTAGQVTLQNGTRISADSTGTGQAGEITIQATAANPTPGTSALTVNNSQVEANTSGDGNAGIVVVRSGGDITLNNGGRVASSTSAAGNSGTVDIEAQNLSLLNGSVVQARSIGTGAPGNIQIDIPNRIVVSGTGATGQISEISTFSGADANLDRSNPSQTPGNIRINQLASPGASLELSDRGRVNALTQSTNASYTGGDIQIAVNSLNIASGGQVIASSLDDGNPATGQAGAGNINISANTINIAGSAPAFADDPNFSSAVILRQLGNTTFSSSDTFLSTGSGAVPVSNLTSTLNLAANTIPTGATNGSAIQLSVLGNTPRQLSFGWTFLTSEFPGSFNDASFVVDGQSASPLADVNGGVFQPSSTPGFLQQTANQTRSITSSNPITIGVVNVTDTAVASGLQLNNIQLDGNPIQTLVFSPDLNRTQPFISGIFARADGTGNAGSVAISGVGAAANLALQDGAQISTSTDSGGQASPSNITVTGLNNLTTSGRSLISASTNSGRAGDVQIDVAQGVNPAITLTENSSIAATALNGGRAGSVRLSTPTLNITDGASVAVSSANGAGTAGNVEINANTVTLDNAAQISAETDAGGASSPANITLQGLQTLAVNNSEISSSTRSGTAGSVRVNAANQITLNGTGGITAAATQGGNAGGVSLTTPTLAIANGASVAVSSANGAGTAGNVDITANTVTLNNTAQISAETDAGGASSPANITLQDLQTLNVNNSEISSSTRSGTAGSVQVNAASQIVLDGNGGITAAATQGGNAGGVNLTTPTLEIANGASVAVSSANGAGTAGNVEINANTVTLNNAAQISAETDAGGASSPANITLQGLQTLAVNNSLISSSTNSGTAGGVTVTAAGQVLLNGTSTGLRDSQGNPLRDRDGNPLGGVVAEARQGGTAGDVRITAGQVTVQNGARASVSSPDGQAGSLQVTTNDLRLTRGTLEAVSGAGDGANITLTVAPGGLLVMRDGSLVSADARKNANGGNITITAPFVIGPTFENNDIVANAIAGNGGQINITTNAIFGLEFRRNRTPRSDITASSETGSSGTVALNTLNIDPSKGLVELPEIPVDRANQLTQGCSTGGDPKNNESRFSVAGRGGVPVSPTVPFTAAATTSDWVSLDPSPQTLSGVTFSNGITVDLVAQSDRIPVTCSNAWKLQQRSQFPTSSTASPPTSSTALPPASPPATAHPPTT